MRWSERWAIGVRRAVLAAVLVLTVVSAAPAGAATIQVTKLTDSLDGACNLDCSLREAITQANLDGTQDVIVLPPGELLLQRADVTDPEEANATGDLDVTRDLVIRGAGAGATVVRAGLPADKPDRIFDVHGNGTDVVMSDLAVTGGDGLLYGGGIRAAGDGELTLERAIVRENTARGQAALGYGGGIYKAMGRLVVLDSAVYANKAVAPGYGGGIFLNNEATSATLTNVTLVGNSAGAYGGAVASNNAIVAQVTHVTVTGNQAGTAEGGLGLDVSEFRLRSSIVAGNTAAADPNCGSTGFAPASDGGNVGDPSCGLTQPSDAQVYDPRLGAFGGAPMPVLEPAADSPALDRAVGTCPPADARGVARPQGPACDAGAAERPVPVAPTPEPPRDVVAPVLSRTSLSRQRFRVGRAATPLAAKRRRATPAGTVFRYSLSETAGVRLTIERSLSGRRVGRACRRPSRRLRSRPRCTRWARVGAAITRTGAAGDNRLAFSGRVGRRALRPGAYRGVLVATDAAGNRSKSAILRFRVVRR